MVSYTNKECCAVIKELTNQFPSVQGFVISNPADIFYLTGFYCVDCLVLYSDDSVLVTDSRYTVASKEASCRAEIACCFICSSCCFILLTPSLSKRYLQKNKPRPIIGTKVLPPRYHPQFA